MKFYEIIGKEHTNFSGNMLLVTTMAQDRVYAIWGGEHGVQSIKRISAHRFNRLTAETMKLDTGFFGDWTVLKYRIVAWEDESR